MSSFRHWSIGCREWKQELWLSEYRSTCWRSRMPLCLGMACTSWRFARGWKWSRYQQLVGDLRKYKSRGWLSSRHLRSSSSQALWLTICLIDQCYQSKMRTENGCRSIDFRKENRYRWENNLSLQNLFSCQLWWPFSILLHHRRNFSQWTYSRQGLKSQIKANCFLDEWQFGLRSAGWATQSLWFHLWTWNLNHRN